MTEISAQTTVKKQPKQTQLLHFYNESSRWPCCTIQHLQRGLKSNISKPNKIGYLTLTWFSFLITRSEATYHSVPLSECEIKLAEEVNDGVVTEGCRREVWLQAYFMAVDKTVFINTREWWPMNLTSDRLRRNQDVLVRAHPLSSNRACCVCLIRVFVMLGLWGKQDLYLVREFNCVLHKPQSTK